MCYVACDHTKFVNQSVLGQLYIVAGDKDMMVMHEVLLNMSLHMYMYMSNTQCMCPWLSAEFVT